MELSEENIKQQSKKVLSSYIEEKEKAQPLKSPKEDKIVKRLEKLEAKLNKQDIVIKEQSRAIKALSIKLEELNKSTHKSTFYNKFRRYILKQVAKQRRITKYKKAVENYELPSDIIKF